MKSGDYTEAIRQAYLNRDDVFFERSLAALDVSLAVMASLKWALGNVSWLTDGIDDKFSCAFCKSSKVSLSNHANEIKHEKTCPYMAAKKLVGGDP